MECCNENQVRLLVKEDVEGFGEFSLEAMDDEEVALVNGVFDGAFGALGDESWCFGLEVEALVDAWRLLGIQKYRSLPLISLDSSYSNIWKLDRLVKENPMDKALPNRPYVFSVEGELVLFYEGELVLFYEGELIFLLKANQYYLGGELVLFVEGESIFSWKVN
nr:hypothetical protein [Tanacetum cinerariifolium]